MLALVNAAHVERARTAQVARLAVQIALQAHTRLKLAVPPVFLVQLAEQQQ
jgi:hypothetical protein